MQGDKRLIDDILATAKAAAEAAVNEATENNTAALKKVQAELDAQRAQAEAEIKAAADRERAGKVKLGELEAGKIMLDAKQRCVSAVYDEVYKKLVGLSNEKYLALMKKLISRTCEDGDEIIASSADKSITDAWVKKLGGELKKKLSLSAERGAISRGVILRNPKYDKSLTFDDIVAELKERTVGDTVARLGL